MLFLTLACTDNEALEPQDTQAMVTSTVDTSPPPNVVDTSPDTAPDTAADTEIDTGLTEVTPSLVFTGALPQNVVVLTIDTLRRDHLSAFGYADNVSPTIDALLTGGVSFMQHRSCSSWTYPSMLCVLTGTDQTALGFFPANNDGAPPSAPDELTLMAERFQAAGYHTMLAGATGFLGDAANMDQGYDQGSSAFDYESYPAGRPAQEVVTQAMGLLGARPKDKPFFLHVHLLDPHMPYQPYDEAYLEGIEKLPETGYDLSTEAGTLELWADFPDLGENAQTVNLSHLDLRYDADIRYTDDRVAELLAYLDAEGFWDDTLLLFFADHGEEFWEHDNFNHGYTAYDEVVASIASVYQPGHLQPATVSSPTTHEDLLPTLAAVVGLEADETWTGVPVGSEDRENLFQLTWRLDKTVQSWTDGNAKLVYRWDGEKEFYELNSDPGEAENLYESEDARIVAAWSYLLPEVNRLSALTKQAVPVDAGP